jgi:hypothetical protein
MWGLLALWVQEAYQCFFCELHHLGEQEHLLEPIHLVFCPRLLYSGILDAISLLLLLSCGCRLRLSLSVASIEYIILAVVPFPCTVGLSRPFI